MVQCFVHICILLLLSVRLPHILHLPHFVLLMTSHVNMITTHEWNPNVGNVDTCEKGGCNCYQYFVVIRMLLGIHETGQCDMDNTFVRITASCHEQLTLMFSMPGKFFSLDKISSRSGLLPALPAASASRPIFRNGESKGTSGKWITSLTLATRSAFSAHAVHSTPEKNR
jgi:hypothetical protein